MDSDDLSLIEIAGEDDSLLQPIPGDGVSSAGTSRTGDYFMCSPLHLPTPNVKPAGGIAANEGSEDTKRLCYRDDVNKENLNMDKAEMVKLSIEPQQMKRKKKGGGYNLRKSLAWDRAFFTEEGVLDPVELSMISGTFSKSKGETLSAIQEEDTNCDGNSSDLQTLEENLFKKVPATTSEIRSNGGSLLPKKRNNEVPTSTATRKVLSAHDVNRSGSKRNACPRPVASSSLKRPSNLVTTTTSTKDSKVSKVPAQKTNPGASSRISKSSTLRASDSKNIARPAVHVQKKSGLKGSSNNNMHVVNNSKAGPAGKSLTTKTTLGQAKRTVLPWNCETNGDLEVTSNPLLPSTRLAPNIHHDISCKRAKPLPQTASHISVNKQHTRLQTAKPSGLRMPSPSLGFFGQSRAPPFQNPLSRTPQPSNLPEPDSSSLRKLGAPNPVFGPRPPLAPRCLPEVMNDGAKTGNIKASCSSLGCAVPSAVNLASQEVVESNSQVSTLQKMEQIVHYNNIVESDSQVPSAIKLGASHPVLKPRSPHASGILSEVINNRAKSGNIKASILSSGSSVASGVNFALHETMESDSQVINLQKMEQKVQHNDNVSEDITSKKESYSTFVSVDNQMLGQTGQVKGKSTSQMEDVIEQRNDGNFLQADTLKVAAKYDTDLKVVEGSTLGTKRSAWENPDLTSLSSSALEVKTLFGKSDINYHLLAKDKPSYLSIEDHGVSSEINVGKFNVNEPFGKQAEMMNALSCEARPISCSQMLQDDVANINSDIQDFIVSEGNASSDCRSTEQENGDTNALGKVRAQSNFKDEGMQSLDGNTTAKSSESYINTSVKNQHDTVFSNVTEKPEYLELPKSLLPREHALQGGIVVRLNDCLIGEQNFFPEELKQENNVFDKPKGTDACESELKRPHTPCLIPVSMEDCGSAMAKLVECQNQGDVPHVPVDSKAVVENYTLDAHFENMDEGSLTYAMSLEDGNVICQRSGRFGVSEQEVPHVTCEPSLRVQVEGDSWKNHTADHDDAEDKQISLSVESSCCNSNSQLEDKFSPDCENTSVGQMCTLRDENDVSKHQEGQDGRVITYSFVSYEDKQSSEACLLFEHSHSLGELQKSENGKITDLSLEVSVKDGNGVESPGLSLHEHMDQALKEFEVVNCMIGEPDGNTKLQGSVNRIKEVFPPNVTGVGLNHASLEDNSAKVFNEENDFENVLEERNEAPIVEVDDLGVNKNAEALELEIAVTSSLQIAPSAENVQFAAGIDCMIGEPDGNSELQGPVIQIKEVFSPSVSGVGLTRMSLAENSAEVLNEENDFENVIKEHNEAPLVLVDDLDVNKKVEPLQVEVAVISSPEIVFSVENMHCVTKCRHENELSYEDNSPKSYPHPNVSESRKFVDCTLDIEHQHKLENTLSTEDKDVTREHKKSGVETKQESLVVKPPPHAIPFSDEWLAAFEAAGEEILTMKSGAVQNSPQDRSQPGPGPWSPVKRKQNQGIGPYDCTKYTSTNQ